MGYRITWIAVKAMPKSELLEHFGFHDTGEIDEANEAAFSVAELPTGWTVLWANDPTFAKSEICSPLSVKAPVLSCWVNETIMLSSVNYFENGNYLWFVGHDSQEGMTNLQSEGQLPTQFDAIRTRLFDEQEANGGLESDVDFIFDVPLELAQSICGFKHDLCEFEWGEPRFTAVRLNKTGAKPTGKIIAKNESWIRRLFR